MAKKKEIEEIEEVEEEGLINPTLEQVFVTKYPKDKFMCVHTLKIDGAVIKPGEPFDEGKKQLDYLVSEGIVRRIRK